MAVNYFGTIMNESKHFYEAPLCKVFEVKAQMVICDSPSSGQT